MENTNENLIAKHKKINRKLIFIYKMLSYDLLFFYTISFLFYMNIKGLTASQIIFGEAFYPIFKILFQIPCTFLIHKLGKRKSLIIANISLCIYLLMLINLINTLTLIIANIFCSFGFVIKGMCESNLLYDSLDETENKRELFSKYEGKANASYYLFDSITALATGYLFVINPYLPLYLSLATLLIASIIAFKFKDIVLEKDENPDKLSNNALEYFKDLKIAFKFILRSSRLKALIVYDSIMISLLTVLIDLRTGLLNQLNVSADMFGIIFAVMGFISSFAATRALYIHKRNRNKTLSVLGIAFTASIIICGIIVFIHVPSFIMFYLILIMFSIQYFCKGSFQPLIKQYLNSFCDSNMRLKIYSATALTESITNTTLALICSLILKIFSPAQTLLLVGVLFTFIMIVILKYMSSRVGLEPSEYPKKDISYSDLV